MKDETALLVIESEVERALIGRILLGNKGQPLPPPDLPPSRFGVERHKVVWAAILDQYRRGEPMDTASVSAALKARGLLEKAGGVKVVSSFETDAGPPDSIPHYVNLLERAAARRAFGPLGRQIAALATWDPDVLDEQAASARYRTLIRRGETISRLTEHRNGHDLTLRTETLYKLLTTPLEPIPWVYEGWLAKGDIVILAGESGLGKSLLALELMVSLSTGRPFIGRLENRTGPQRVLYLDEENNPRLIRYRLHRLIDGLDLGLDHIDPAVIDAEYALENAVRVDDPASLQRVQRTVEAFQPDWVIFDSMIRFHRQEENRSEAMAMVAGTMKAIARKSGGGAVIIHHLGKPSKERQGSMKARIRGSSDIPAVGDMIWTLHRPSIEADSLLFSTQKSRWGQEPNPLAVAIEDIHLGNGVRLTGSEPEKDAMSVIVEALRDSNSDGLSRPAISILLERSGLEAAERTLSRNLKKLRSDGTTVQKRDGKAMRYWLGDFAPSGAE